MNDLVKHQLILGLGLIIGIVLAAMTIVKKNNIDDQNYAAKIEDRFIPYERYQMQLEGLANDKRSPLTLEDKAYVLERMIEEELLIKRAIDLGMLENNPMARGTIVQQMIKNIISEGSRTEPEEKELIKFFEENRSILFVSREKSRMIILITKPFDCKFRIDHSNNCVTISGCDRAIYH